MGNYYNVFFLLSNLLGVLYSSFGGRGAMLAAPTCNGNIITEAPLGVSGCLLQVIPFLISYLLGVLLACIGGGGAMLADHPILKGNVHENGLRAASVMALGVGGLVAH